MLRKSAFFYANLCSGPRNWLNQGIADMKDSVVSALQGMKMEVIDLMEGLAESTILIYYGLRADVAIIVREVSTSPPELTDNAISDYDRYVYAPLKPLSNQ
ncbi:MAG: hypothetical protein ACI4GW_02345 [Lachnospiraceae bacterium]